MSVSKRQAEEATTKRQWKPKGEVLSWGIADPGDVADTIRRVTDNGASILFTRDPDGRSLIVKVYAGTDGCKEWLKGSEDVMACLDWIRETFG